MTLEDYKQEIGGALDEAAMVLSCEDHEKLVDWLHEEGLV